MNNLNLNKVLKIKKQFKIILNYAILFFSLLVCVSLMSGCAHNQTRLKNSNNQKWEDYFDSNEFKPVNERNLNLKQKLKKAM